MAFTSNTYTATLDIKRRTPHRPLIIEGDAGVLLDLSLTDNGVAMDITGLYARCVFRRSDGRTVLVSESDDPCPMTVTKATGRIVITAPRTCFRDGDNFLQVQILDGDPDSGTCLSSTFPLLLRAYNCLLTNEAVEESVEFPILEWLIDALRNMTVTGVTIDPDDDGWPTATASLALTDGAYHLTLGIPRGNGIASVVVDSTNPQLIITYEDGTVALAMLNGIASQTWVEAQEYIDADELSAALTDYATKAYVAHAIANAGYYSKPVGGIPVSDLAEAVQDSLDLADSAIQEADLAGYYQLPSGGIPSTDMSAAVQLALARANSALQDMTVMEGATSQKNGTKGAVPAPQTTDVNKFLKGDGTWATPSGGGGGGGTTDDVTVKLPATIVPLGAVETGDLVSEAMAQVNNLVDAVEDLQDDKLDVNGDGSSVYATRGSASINYGDIPATDPVTLRDLLRRLGGWYAEINNKQATLTAGTGISISNNVISATGGGGGMTTDAKEALLALLAKVAYTDDDGEELLNNLAAALNESDLISITATFTQGDAEITEATPLSALRQYLVVTANYPNSETIPITSYTLSGTLTEGSSTITASYGGKTATFTVTVLGDANGLVDGTYHPNFSNYLYVTDNTLTWSDPIQYYPTAEVPFIKSINLYAGDVVKLIFTRRNSGSSSGQKSQVKLMNDTTSTSTASYGYSTAGAETKTINISEDITVTKFSIQGASAMSGLAFSLSMQVNDVEVF